MAPEDHFIRRAEIVRVIDGDTIQVNIDQGFGSTLQHNVRLSDIDAPEPRGVESLAGKFVTSQVLDFFGEQTEVVIHSKVFKLGSWGRCIAEVWLGDVSLNRWLLESGYAWPADHSGSIIGLRAIERLTGIPIEIRQEVARAMQ